MQKIFLVIGTVLAGLAVVLGAFGAHGLQKIVSPDRVAIYQTGVQYQMYHALALVLTGIMSERILNSYLSYAGVMFVTGVILFSGSLYLIVSLYAMNKTVPKAVGILTPVGGLFFIFGWVCLLISILKK
jgi:uncharacterized membrane protein YgdD (TMEM256/DUF423 family)